MRAGAVSTTASTLRHGRNCSSRRRRIAWSVPARRSRSATTRKWSVPEPELVLFISPGGKIVGYTIGNDMSSRDIEGENPLYLPQAKVYDRSCALGPCLLVSDEATCLRQPKSQLKFARRQSWYFPARPRSKK